MSGLRERLERIFGRFPQLNIVMLGDFFIDQYLHLERQFSEVSLETGLEAFQVTAIRNSLGAAGTVANNLCAMGVNVHALTVRGKDANGYVMERIFREQQINSDHVVVADHIFTPTYTKPMMLEANGSWHELNRIDIKNRRSLPDSVERSLLEGLKDVLVEADAVLVTDQVQEAGCGVVTRAMRDALSAAAVQKPSLPIWVDSRERGSQFTNVALKTNVSEAKKSLGLPVGSEITPLEAAELLHKKNGKPVLITAGEWGIAYCDAKGSGVVPALRMEEPLDIVGAGDSVLAGSGTAIAASASLPEAALIGCLAASVTIKKIGTTGTASVTEMLENLELFEKQNPTFTIGN